MIGNLFSSKSSDKQKDNLIVFLTPHIVRNKSELRDLALDERQRFVNSLGRKEIHDMPASQIREIYKPSFSIPVSPAADLNAPYNGPAAPPGPENPGAAYESSPSGSSADTLQHHRDRANLDELDAAGNEPCYAVLDYRFCKRCVSGADRQNRGSDPTTSVTMGSPPPYPRPR